MASLPNCGGKHAALMIGSGWPVAEGGGGATARQFFETLIALAEATSTSLTSYELIFGSSNSSYRARTPRHALAGSRCSTQTLSSGMRSVNRAAGRRGFSLTPYSPATATATGSTAANSIPRAASIPIRLQIWAAAPGGRIAAAVIPVGREGVAIEEDWDGFGQRLTGAGATRLYNVRVEFERVRGSWRSVRTATPKLSRRFPPALPSKPSPPGCSAACERRHGLGQAPGAEFQPCDRPADPSQDPQVLQVVGEMQTRSPRRRSC